MARKTDLVAACAVFWGEWVDSDECALSNSDNPEKQAIVKDALSKLSDEARFFANVLMNLPDEMFVSSGRIIQRKLLVYMKKHFNWSIKKTKIVQAEIAILMQD